MKRIVMHRILAQFVALAKCLAQFVTLAKCLAQFVTLATGIAQFVTFTKCCYGFCLQFGTMKRLTPIADYSDSTNYTAQPPAQNADTFERTGIQ